MHLDDAVWPSNDRGKAWQAIEAFEDTKITKRTMDQEEDMSVLFADKSSNEGKIMAALSYYSAKAWQQRWCCCLPPPQQSHTLDMRELGFNNNQVHSGQNAHFLPHERFWSQNH